MATAHSPREHLRYLSMLRSYLLGALAVIVTTFICWHFRSFLGSASILLLYTLQVFLVAYAFGLGPSILSVIYSVSAFAFFFAPPIFSFAVHDPHTFLALLVLLIVAFVTSSLMQRLRDQIALTQRNASRTDALLDLAQLCSERISDETLAIRLSELFSKHLSIDASLWLMKEPIVCGVYTPDLPLHHLPGTWYPAAVRQLLEHPAPGLPGSKDPEGGRYLLLKTESSILGIIRFNTTQEADDLDPDETSFMEDFIEQIAHQVDRLKPSQE